MAELPRLPKKRKDMLSKTSGDFLQPPSLSAQGPGTAGTPGTDDPGSMYPLFPPFPPPGGIERETGECDPVVIEPAHPHAKPIYFEDIAGRIRGPAIPEFLAQTGRGLKSTDYWIVTTFDGEARWIRSDRLRSKKAFDTQKPVRLVERIREVK